MRYDCPECSSQVKVRRTVRAKERLDKDRHGKAILYTVLTVPPEFRSRFVDRKIWRSEIRKIWRDIRTHFAGEFSLECSHPYGSPEEGDYSPDVFHPHVNFLWRQRPGASPFLDVGTLIVLWTAQLNGIPKKHALDVWREIRDREEDLTRSLELVRCALDVRTMSVVWHHYFKDPVELSKRIAYVCRTFPGFSSWTGSMRWLGHFPRNLEVRIWCCPKCKEPYLFAGRSDEDEYREFVERSQQETRAGPDDDVPGHGNYYT